MTTPTSMGNHGGTVTSCSPYAYPGFAEICILLRTWSTVALGTYELAFLIKKNVSHTPSPAAPVKRRVQPPLDCDSEGEVAVAMTLFNTPSQTRFRRSGNGRLPNTTLCRGIDHGCTLPTCNPLPPGGVESIRT